MPAPTTDSPLFSAEDLADLVNEEISDEKAAIVESVVWGWIKRATGLTVRPAEVPEELFSSAIELGAIFCENPSGLAAYQLGEERSQYSSERRDSILDVLTGSPDGSSSGNNPRGTFPPALSWPAGFWGP